MDKAPADSDALPSAVVLRLIAVNVAGTITLCFGLAFTLSQSITYYRGTWKTDRKLLRALWLSVLLTSTLYTAFLALVR